MSKDKFATQSTTYAAGTSHVTMYVAGHAVDRDITTCMRTDAIGGSSPVQRVWWKVDLKGVYSIYSVNILFKNYVDKGKLNISHKKILCKVDLGERTKC